MLRDSYVNFGTITDEDINKLRLKHRLKVVQGMEESLLNSIARSVSKQCLFSNEQIKDLFYIYKQISKIGIIDGASDNLSINKEQFLKLNKELCEWRALCEPDVAAKIFDVNFRVFFFILLIKLLFNNTKKVFKMLSFRAT